MVKLIDGGELAALQEENNRLFIENKALVGKLDAELREHELTKFKLRQAAARLDEITKEKGVLELHLQAIREAWKNLTGNSLAVVARTVDGNGS